MIFVLCGALAGFYWNVLHREKWQKHDQEIKCNLNNKFLEETVNWSSISCCWRQNYRCTVLKRDEILNVLKGDAFKPHRTRKSRYFLQWDGNYIPKSAFNILNLNNLVLFAPGHPHRWWPESNYTTLLHKYCPLFQFWKTIKLIFKGGLTLGMRLEIIEQIMTFKSQFELCQVMQTHLGQRARKGGGSGKQAVIFHSLWQVENSTELLTTIKTK